MGLPGETRVAARARANALLSTYLSSEFSASVPIPLHLIRPSPGPARRTTRPLLIAATMRLRA